MTSHAYFEFSMSRGVNSWSRRLTKINASLHKEIINHDPRHLVCIGFRNNFNDREGDGAWLTMGHTMEPSLLNLTGPNCCFLEIDMRHRAHRHKIDH